MCGDDTSLRLFPNIKWLPSRSASPREAHIPFYNRIWAKDDPFWQENTPGSLWNCKCSWQQTSEPVTPNNPSSQTPISMPGLRGNPGITGKIFSDDAPYFRRPNETSSIRKDNEKHCQSLEQKIVQKNHKQYENSTASATINNQIQTVNIAQWGVKETAHSMFGSKHFWLKNQILNNLDFFLKKAQYIGSKNVDLSRNTGKTLKRKKKFKLFHYLNVSVLNEKFCLQVVEMLDGKFYLYTITKQK